MVGVEALRQSREASRSVGTTIPTPKDNRYSLSIATLTILPEDFEWDGPGSRRRRNRTDMVQRV